MSKSSSQRKNTISRATTMDSRPLTRDTIKLHIRHSGLSTISSSRLMVILLAKCRQPPQQRVNKLLPKTLRSPFLIKHRLQNHKLKAKLLWIPLLRLTLSKQLMITASTISSIRAICLTTTVAIRLTLLPQPLIINSTMLRLLPLAEPSQATLKTLRQLREPALSPLHPRLPSPTNERDHCKRGLN